MKVFAGTVIGIHAFTSVRQSVSNWAKDILSSHTKVVWNVEVAV
jgi:hypothetical protein